MSKKTNAELADEFLTHLSDEGFDVFIERRHKRNTPAVLDLTTQGAIGELNEGIFRQVDSQPTGTGVIDSFVRIQSTKGAVQQGYNTDSRPLQFDENKSPQFTRSLRLDAIPIVNIGGVNYREFLLDINQKASQPLLSLDELRIYVGNSGSLSGYNAATHQLAGLDAVFDLDGNGDNWIKLNARLNQGSGKGDMLAYIPDAAFEGGSFVYVYSKFGVNHTADAGFEEWAVARGGSLAHDNGVISGTVFNQATNAGLADQLVFLDANHNGLLDDDEIFTFTDGSGNYEFDNLTTGLGGYSIYDVTVDPTAGSAVTSSFDVSLQTDGQMTDVDFAIFFPPPPPPPGGGGGGGGFPPS